MCLFAERRKWQGLSPSLSFVSSAPSFSEQKEGVNAMHLQPCQLGSTHGIAHLGLAATIVAGKRVDPREKLVLEPVQQLKQHPIFKRPAHAAHEHVPKSMADEWRALT